MKELGYFDIKRQIAWLKHTAEDYSGKTIDNIIQQLEARVKEVEKIERNSL